MKQLTLDRLKWGIVIAIGLALIHVDLAYKNKNNLQCTKKSEELQGILNRFDPGSTYCQNICVTYVNNFYFWKNTMDMHLQDIYIYPIKSLAGIRLLQSEVQIRGLSLDRRWMLVDQKGRFLTQRTVSQMALLRVRLDEEGLYVYHKHYPERAHLVPFTTEKNDLVSITLWQDHLQALLVNKSSDQWFSEVLGLPCQLVHMPSTINRWIEEKYAVHNETVSFADAMPFLIIGQSSLEDLNRKLSAPLAMDRFRPNFVFSGEEPFSEDHWTEVEIGECLFKRTKPCARCIITTIDQETAAMGKEPLKTLATYRSIGNKVIFGQNMIALTTGTVKVGDILTAKQ